MSREPYTKPYLINFGENGEADIGYISVAESFQQVPFAIQRCFWTYDTPETIVRGRHAHHKTEQVIIAVSGRIVVLAELPDGELATFSLAHPRQGVYLPPNVWHTMQYSPGAIQLVVASTPFAEEDYIRDYQEFRQVWG